MDADFFIDLCEEAARSRLPELLAMLCDGRVGSSTFEISGEASPTRMPGIAWCFQDLPCAVLRVMEEHAKDVSKRLAMTEVARRCFNELEYAWSEKVLVQIEGDSRFGKTEAIKTWCAMYPGRARLVTTPCSSSEADLYRAVADAMGISYTPATSGRVLKDLVEFTTRHAGMMLVFDEAHWLLPTRYTSTTAPMRLNWLRTQIVDRRLPCVIVSTPQAFQNGVQRFVQKTGYTMEQFMGRRMIKLRLPAELDEADLHQVARIHFPQLNDDHLLLIVAKAMQSENYLQAVEAIATRARYLARQAGRTSVCLAQVDRAIEDVFPTQPSPGTIVAAPRQQSRKARAEPLQPARNEDAAPGSGRQTRPDSEALTIAERPISTTRNARPMVAELSVADS
jgi:hypothetical protein